MGLIIRVVIEIILVPVLFFSAMMFWQCVHQRRYTKRLAQDDTFLDEFISKLNGEQAFRERTAGLEPLNGSWAYNIMLVSKVELGALSQMRLFSLAVCIAVFIGTYFLGVIFLAINVAIFASCALLGATTAARGSSLQYLLSTAQIMYRWKREDEAHYTAFLRDAAGVHKLAAALDRHAT